MNYSEFHSRYKFKRQTSTEMPLQVKFHRTETSKVNSPSRSLPVDRFLADLNRKASKWYESHKTLDSIGISFKQNFNLKKIKNYFIENPNLTIQISHIIQNFFKTIWQTKCLNAAFSIAYHWFCDKRGRCGAFRFRYFSFDSFRFFFFCTETRRITHTRAKVIFQSLRLPRARNIHISIRSATAAATSRAKPEKKILSFVFFCCCEVK